MRTSTSLCQAFRADKNIDKPVEFKGIRLRLSKSAAGEDAFQHIEAGKSVEVTFDVAETHDLSQGGEFNIAAKGALQYALEHDDTLIGAASSSASITASIDGAAAAAVQDNQNMRRTTFQRDCTGSRGQAVSNAANNCVSLSRQASRVASSGPASKMQEFFKSSSQQVRSQVANVFDRVAAECPNNGGYSRTYCSDVGGYCGGNVLAYTVPSQSYIVYCDLYFNNLPPLTSACHRQDQATTNLHETTHLSEVAGTDDLGYGYDNIRRLSTQQSLNNADSYAVFANSIYAGC